MIEAIADFNGKLKRIDELITMLMPFNLDSKNYIYNSELIARIVNELESCVDSADKLADEHPLLNSLSSWNTDKNKIRETIGVTRYALELAKHVDPNDPSL
ncbi:MAG: hypothetical protein NC548_45830 [Lachnospiraceae bacterium]|nr:hypothetical protein [Lachnospiraceae bacterium]